MLLLTQVVLLLVQLRLQQLQHKRYPDFVHHLTLRTKTVYLKDAAAEVAVAVQYVHQELNIDVLTYK